MTTKLTKQQAKLSLSHRVFNELSNFVQQNYGIVLTSKKKFMVEQRLNKPFMVSHYTDINEFVLESINNSDINVQLTLIDALSTNKTDFFREPKHFEYLTQVLLPELVNTLNRSTLHIWSAACSNGAEPYTLSMVIDHWIKAHDVRHLQYQITASDISVSMLNKASKACYTKEEIAGIPPSLRPGYLLRHKTKDNVFKISQDIRRHVNFKLLNLTENQYSVDQPVSIIFCRNVLIYFSKETREAIIKRFYRKLPKGGILFIGHSESISNMPSLFKQVAPTIYRKV